MIKIVGILSSPHRNGSTSKLLIEAIRGAKDSGAETELIYLPDYDIRFCIGCQMCLANDNCSLEDNINSLREKILQADGVILASPTYEEDFNAMMKNFFDRITPFTGYRSSFRNKYAVGISTTGCFGAKKTAKRMVDLITTGWHRLGKVSGTLGASVGWGDVDPYKPKAYRLGQRIVEDIQIKRRYPFQMFIKKMAFGLFIRRVMEKMIIENKDGRRKAVYQYLKNEGLISK